MKGVLGEQQIASMYEFAGFACGVGEWRNEKGGEMGRFHVASVEIARKKTVRRAS